MLVYDRKLLQLVLEPVFRRLKLFVEPIFHLFLQDPVDRGPYGSAYSKNLCDPIDFGRDQHAESPVYGGILAVALSFPFDHTAAIRTF